MGEWTFQKAGELAGVIGYCKVTVTKKVSYVNIAGKDREGEEWVEAMDKALLIMGRRQMDVEAPGPVFKELKMALRSAREL